MAATRGKRQNVQNSRRAYGSYIEGNTVRKVEPVYDAPARKPRRQTEAKEIVIGYEKREAVLGLGYTLFLIISLALILGACILYMNANIQLSRVKRAVLLDQERLSEIMEENAALSEEVSDVQINLEEIYQTATDSLGMVYAGQDQIVYYDSSNSDYIRQFGEIPD